jgi:NTP pyrophosphatase (non-canonical NTP hydrolase)
VDIRQAQQEVWANKVAKGFNTTDVPKEFMLMVEEAGEAFSAWRKEKPDFGERLADVAAFLFGVAEMTGVDLDREIEAKMQKVREREYEPLPNGTLVKRDREMGE